MENYLRLRRWFHFDRYMLACGKEEIVKCLYVCKEAKQKEEAMTLEIGQDKDNRYRAGF